MRVDLGAFLARRPALPALAFRTTCWLSSRNINDNSSLYPGHTRFPLIHWEHVGRAWSQRIFRDRHSPQPLLGFPQKTMLDKAGLVPRGPRGKLHSCVDDMVWS